MPPKQPNPPAAEQLTVKQQRAANRAKKLESYRKEQLRRVRNRRIAIVSSIVGGVAVVALVVTAIVLTPEAASYTAGGSGAEVAGVKTFSNAAGHVEGTVDYEQTPPAGGEHNQVWLNCGVYTEPQQNENAVHALEHGAVWVTYNPAMADADVDALRELLPSSYVILSPFEGMDSEIAVSAWNAQLTTDEVDDPRIVEFIEEYWKSASVPEPGALCSGALEGPGKVA